MFNFLHKILYKDVQKEITAVADYKYKVAITKADKLIATLIELEKILVLRKVKSA